MATIISLTYKLDAFKLYGVPESISIQVEDAPTLRDFYAMNARPVAEGHEVHHRRLFRADGTRQLITDMVRGIVRDESDIGPTVERLMAKI